MSTYTEDETRKGQEARPDDLRLDDRQADGRQADDSQLEPELQLYDPKGFEENPDQQYPQINRITQVGNGSLAQMLVNAQTYANLSPDEEGARQEILDVAETVRQAEEAGIEVDVSKYRINGSGNAADLGMMLAAAKADVEQQMERQNEQQLKDDAVKREEEEKAKAKEAEGESMSAQEIIGSAAFIGAAAAAGAGAAVALPAFLMNPAAPNMSQAALTAATAAGAGALGMMGLGMLAMSQSMGNEVLCRDTHHGLAASGQQRQLQAGIS